MAATISNAPPVDVSLASAKQSCPPTEDMQDRPEQPKLLSMLQHLPSCGHWAPDAAVCVAKSVAPYVCTHEGAQPPAGQLISTDNSTEAWIRLLRRRAPAAAPGSETAKTAGTAKRVLETPATNSTVQKKQKAAGKETPSADTPMAKQLDKELQKASKPEAGSTKNNRKAPAPSTGEASTSRAAQQSKGSKEEPPGSSNGQGNGDATPAGEPNKSPYFNAPPAAAAALSAAVQGQSATKVTYDHDQLRKMQVKELKEVCKARSLQVSGNKEQLVMRIVEYQRRLKLAQRSS